MRYEKLVAVLLFTLAPAFHAGAARTTPLTTPRTTPVVTVTPPARAAMEQIQALQGEHVLEIPPAYHYRYATVWNALAAWDRSLAGGGGGGQSTCGGGEVSPCPSFEEKGALHISA